MQIIIARQLNKQALDDATLARFKSAYLMLDWVLIEQIRATIPSGKKQNIDVNIEQTK